MTKCANVGRGNAFVGRDGDYTFSEGLSTQSRGAIDTRQTWASDWSDLLTDLKVDLTLICGSHDANMPPDLVAAVRKRLSLPKVEIIEGAGSFLLMDAPEKPAHAIRRAEEKSNPAC